MVHSTIAEVNKGHFVAMKYLFEMVGLYPATSAEQMPQDNSLAKILLRRLDLPEEPELASAVTKDSAAAPAGTEGDAVE